MGVLERLLGGNSDAEDVLWAPDPEEENDPRLHARNCRKRWEVTLSILREVRKSARDIRIFLFVIAVLVAVNASPQVASIVQAIQHTVFGGKS